MSNGKYIFTVINKILIQLECLNKDFTRNNTHSKLQYRQWLYKKEKEIIGPILNGNSKDYQTSN